MHGGQSGLVALRVDLDMLDPDVLPEAQTHHIQVVAAVAEGTCQLHKHCQHIIVDSVFRYEFLMTRLGRVLKESGSFLDVTFPVSEVCWVQLDNTL